MYSRDSERWSWVRDSSLKEKKIIFLREGNTSHLTCSSASLSSKYMFKPPDELTDLWTPSTPSQSQWRRQKATPPWLEAQLFWSRCTSETWDVPSRRQISESVGVKGKKPTSLFDLPIHSSAGLFLVLYSMRKYVRNQILRNQLPPLAAHLWNDPRLLSGKTTCDSLTWYISTRCSVVRACGFGALKMRNSALTKVLEFRSTLVTSKPTILKYGLWGIGLIESVEQKQDSLWPYLHFVVCAWFSEGQPQGNKTCFGAKAADVMTNPFQLLRGLTELKLPYY